MSPEDEPHGSSSIAVGCGDPDPPPHRRPSRRNKGRVALQTPTSETVVSGGGDSSGGNDRFLQALLDAEAAANAAAVQLASFKDAMEMDPADSRQSSEDKRRAKRQRGLLLEKLEDFRQTNKSVRQKLKQLTETEMVRVETGQQIDILLNKVTEAEIENERLKGGLDATERRVEELMEQRRKEQENVKMAVSVSRCVEETRAHLQGQLRNKEAENQRLTVQLRTLERTLVERKMELGELKGSIASLTEKATQEKESLKKATRAQKLRAERFEAAIEKCYAQLKEKDTQLVTASSEMDSWRQKKEKLTEERDKLAAQAESLKSQIAELTSRLQRKTQETTEANATAVQRVDELSEENGNLLVNNASLKASVARLEQHLAESESALVEERLLSQERKRQVEQSQHLVSGLQAEMNDMRIKYANVLRETEKMNDGRKTEAEKVRQQLQARVDELKVFPELLTAAQRGLSECQESLQRSERTCSEKAELIKHLQVQMESQEKLLTSSREMRESIREANVQLQEKVSSAQRQTEQLLQDNVELLQKLSAQEESLSFSRRQLEQQTAESQSLSRQLETALSDHQLQVQRVKGQAGSREESLQSKIQELEAERSRRDKELRLLRQSKLSAEKRFEVRLKDLQLSLEQSESHKQRIQNYVSFLKNSYSAMFDEGPLAPSFPSSYLFK